MTRAAMTIGTLTILIFTLQSAGINAQETKILAAGTRMYLTLDKQVTTRHGDVEQSEIVAIKGSHAGRLSGC